MKFNKDNTLYLVVFSFVCCGLFVAGLAVANELTRERVEANRNFAAQSAVLDALGLRYGDMDEAAALYARTVRSIDGSSPPAYSAALDDGVHYAVEASGAGLWGTISVIVASDAKVTRIDGIQVLSQNETPGLGGRIDEAWFKNQFRGEAIANGRIGVSSGAEAKGIGDADKDNALVDGVTGATRTTQAMEAILGTAIKRLETVAGGGK